MTLNVRKTLWQIFKFAFVGALGSILNLTILYLLTEYAHIWYFASEILAILCAFMFNFYGNVKNGNIKLAE